MENHQKSKLNIKQRFSYGVGNVLNEIPLYMYLSFSIIFLMQVIGLSASQAGLAMLIGQITDAFTSPITGFLGDRVQIPFISKKLGRRKSWHLVGTVMMAGGFPLLFNRCLVCNDYQGVSWLQPFYYYCIMVIINAACNILEINHLSITFTAAGTVQEGAALTAIRLTAITLFSFVHNFLILIFWILFSDWMWSHSVVMSVYWQLTQPKLKSARFCLCFFIFQTFLIFRFESQMQEPDLTGYNTVSD